MAQTTMNLTAQQHLQCGKAMFNFTWTLLEKADRTEDESEVMIKAAHASALHWLQVGKPVNFARSEWQISRVYGVLNRAEPAAARPDRPIKEPTWLWPQATSPRRRAMQVCARPRPPAPRRGAGRRRGRRYSSRFRPHELDVRPERSVGPDAPGAWGRRVWPLALDR